MIDNKIAETTRRDIWQQCHQIEVAHKNRLVTLQFIDFMKQHIQSILQKIIRQLTRKKDTYNYGSPIGMKTIQAFWDIEKILC